MSAVLLADIGLVETDLFVEGVFRQLGVDFRGYDRALVRHKLGQFCALNAIENISSLQGRVLRDADCARAALRFLAASASAFLTDADNFLALRLAVLPVLRSASWPAIWIAECAEAGVVTQMVSMLDQEGLLGKSQIFVTNANQDILDDVSRLHADSPENIVWGQYDLASDASFKECHLIVCQRPFAQFNLALQRRALGIFGDSVCNFGIVQLEASGRVLSADLARQFTCLLSEQGIYRRRPTHPGG